MSYYWELRKTGLSRSDIEQSNDFMQLHKMGFYYTDTERRTHMSLSFNTIVRRYGKLIPCWDEDVVISFLREKSKSLGRAAFSSKDAVLYLNEQEIYTKTGKKWNEGSFATFKTKWSAKDKRIIHRKKRKHTRQEKVLAFHKKVHSVFREVVEEKKVVTLGAMCTAFNEMRFRTRMGNFWSREGLTLIVRNNSDWDWSLFDVDSHRTEQRAKLLALKKDIIESTDWSEIVSIKEVSERLGLDRQNWLVREVHSERCPHWSESPQFLEYIKTLVSACETRIQECGYQSFEELASYFNKCGFKTNFFPHNAPKISTNVWYGSTVQRILQLHTDFNKDDFYASIVNECIEEFLLTYDGTTIVKDLCDHLNQLGRYPIMAWGNGSFFRNKEWDVFFLKRCIGLGVFPCLG